jgi:hypothetical protein
VQTAGQKVHQKANTMVDPSADKKAGTMVEKKVGHLVYL